MSEIAGLQRMNVFSSSRSCQIVIQSNVIIASYTSIISVCEFLFLSFCEFLIEVIIKNVIVSIRVIICILWYTFKQHLCILTILLSLVKCTSNFLNFCFILKIMNRLYLLFVQSRKFLYYINCKYSYHLVHYLYLFDGHILLILM